MRTHQSTVLAGSRYPYTSERSGSPARSGVSERATQSAAIIVAWCIVSLVMLAVHAFPASADTGEDERRFVELINDLREEKGLEPLLVDVELRMASRLWSQRMADSGVLQHSDDLGAGITRPWKVLGENVGEADGRDVDGLFKAFVASPTHYDNLVDPEYRFIGVGVIYGEDGKLWTTHRFMTLEQPQVTSATPPKRSDPPASTPSRQVDEPPETRTTQPATTQPAKKDEISERGPAPTPAEEPSDKPSSVDVAPSRLDPALVAEVLEELG